MPHNILGGPWEKAGIDICQYGSHDYLLVADYLSKFPHVMVLSNQMTAHVIDFLKWMFSEHGILA